MLKDTQNGWGNPVRWVWYNNNNNGIGRPHFHWRNIGGYVRLVSGLQRPDAHTCSPPMWRFMGQGPPWISHLVPLLVGLSGDVTPEHLEDAFLAGQLLAPHLQQLVPGRFALQVEEVIILQLPKGWGGWVTPEGCGREGMLGQGRNKPPYRQDGLPHIHPFDCSHQQNCCRDHRIPVLNL